VAVVCGVTQAVPVVYGVPSLGLVVCDVHNLVAVVYVMCPGCVGGRGVWCAQPGVGGVRCDQAVSLVCSGAHAVSVVCSVPRLCV
jgi:hypothetical protein